MGTGTGGHSTTLVPTRLLAFLRGTQASEGVHPPDAPEPRPLNDAPEPLPLDDDPEPHP